MTETAHPRVRFAPSPTGHLHLGSARTGLYNYIFARQHEGTFILRIEDTDVSRSTDEAILQIIDSMKEMGLHWDEGPGVPGPHGPYRQTERGAIYHEYVERLLGTGHLYPCFCTPGELETERTAAQQEGRGWVYSGKCRGLDAEEVERRQAAGEPYTLRVVVPTGRTVFHDLLRGDVGFENDTIGDFIVQRSDGTATYNLAVVVDDVTMEITHVIRGDDHISNTPKQVVIYEALGVPAPEFLHMPLLFGTDKKKLSKRHGVTKLEQLTAEGYLVEVVRNYLCFLSAEFDETMITWSLDDLVANFDVTKLGTSPSIFDPEKLRWMNGRYVRAMTDEWLGGRLVEYLTRVGFYGDPDGIGELAAKGPQALAAVLEGVEAEHVPPVVPDEEQEALTREVAPLVHEKIEVLADFIPMAGWFFRPLAFSPEALERLQGAVGAAETLAAASAGLRALEQWDVPAIETLVRELPAALELKPKAVFAALRLGMSGQSVTPGLFESLWALGRDNVVARLDQAAALL
ncbi:MAG: glutamate--tRNA ligase [Thermoleophilia bacterium]|nr:glutamate--tRNA ligase [Thermoleophilia bacterium]